MNLEKALQILSYEIYMNTFSRVNTMAYFTVITITTVKEETTSYD